MTPPVVRREYRVWRSVIVRGDRPQWYTETWQDGARVLDLRRLSFGPAPRGRIWRDGLEQPAAILARRLNRWGEIMTQNGPLRIVIAASHELVRAGLARVLARRAEFEVVGQAATAAEAKELVDLLEPDVVVMDTHLHDQPGVVASREIRSRHPGVKVLLLTTYSNDEAVVSAVVAGAAGFLLKEMRSGEVVQSLRRLGQGHSLLNPTVTLRVLERVRAGIESDSANSLSQLESDLLALMAQGATDGEIAAAVSLSEAEVRQHIDTLWTKLECARKEQSITYSATWRSRILRR